MLCYQDRTYIMISLLLHLCIYAKIKIHFVSLDIDVDNKFLINIKIECEHILFTLLFRIAYSMRSDTALNLFRLSTCFRAIVVLADVTNALAVHFVHLYRLQVYFVVIVYKYVSRTF